MRQLTNRVRQMLRSSLRTKRPQGGNRLQVEMLEKREMLSGNNLGPIVATTASSHTASAQASIATPPLQVLPGSFAGTPSGFSLQFNEPILVNAATPVLFGKGYGATAPVPSVALTQVTDGSGNPVNNPVEGSLIINPATNTITFLATDTAYEVNNGSPLLPDGTYRVDLRSSAARNGFESQNGSFLDGLGIGKAGSGDFTAAFTVSAGAAKVDVLWVPPTAEGPGQALNAPGNNRTGGGYPIYLNDSTGTVTNVQFTFNYDPTLLTVTGVSGAGFTLVGSSTPGHAVLQYSGPALPVGSQTPIGFINATVPSGTTVDPMPYKAQDLLHLSNVALNGGAIPVATSDALHLVAYVGDADGNGTYSSNDAMLVTRALLQTDSGFAAYPRVDPVIVADTDGCGFIPADAALQVNEASVNMPAANLTNPAIPSSVHLTNTAGASSNSAIVHPGIATVDTVFAALGSAATTNRAKHSRSSVELSVPTRTRRFASLIDGLFAQDGLAASWKIEATVIGL